MTEPGEPVKVAVVGVDGSASSLAALAWAAEVVGSEGTLHVVTVGENASRRAELEAEWLEPLASAGPSSQLHLADHDPAEVVTEFADATGAGLIALGAHSGLAHLPRAVGGVVHKSLRRAHCPVAVVRDTAGAAAPVDSARPESVIVGVGGSSSMEPATAWAATLARSRSVPLELVRVVNFHPFLGVNDAAEVLASYVDPKQLVTWAREELEVVAENVAATGLETQRYVASGDVGSVLVRRAQGAAALVVGKHFDGKITGYFTGRTVHHVLTHATCPVVVVPASAGAAGSAS